MVNILHVLSLPCFLSYSYHIAYNNLAPSFNLHGSAFYVFPAYCCESILAVNGYSDTICTSNSYLFTVGLKPIAILLFFVHYIVGIVTAPVIRRDLCLTIWSILYLYILNKGCSGW